MKKNLIYALISLVIFSSCRKEEDEAQVQLDPPVIYSISPLEARPGSTVTIDGENFSRLRVDNKVYFNGIEAEIIHFNETTINARAPEGSTDGPVSVDIAGKTAKGPVFSFIQPPAPTGETVVLKVLSIGAQPWSAAGAHNTQGYLTYYGALAKELDVDFMVAREMDSVTNRSVQVDRPKFLSEHSGLDHYMFSRAILAGYQGGQFGIAVYSKYPLLEELSVSLNNNRTLGLIKVQLTPQSQIAFGGVQLEDVIGSQTLRNTQASLLTSVLNDVMIPTIVAGGLFMLGQEPLEDPMFQVFDQAGYRPGCTSCDFTFPANATTPAIADFVMYKWAREARVVKYEVLDPAPGANRSPVYAEIEFSL